MSQNHEQIDAWLDGDLAAEELDALNQRLASDPGFADDMARGVQLHAALRRVHSNAAALADQAAAVTGADRFRFAPVAYAAAAALAVAVVVALYAVALIPDPVDPEPARGPAVATLIDATGVVMVNDDIANPGDDYRSGVYSISRGFAEFQLTSGASVRLVGRSRLAVHDPMNATLAAGMASFDCPPSAVGYAVGLGDGTRVVDLGTRFTTFVDANAGRSVFVEQGVVEIRPPDAAPVRVMAGQLAGLDTAGVWVIARSLDEALRTDWAQASAISALLPHMLEYTDALVLHEPLAGGADEGRFEFEQAMRFAVDTEREPVLVDGAHARFTLATWVKLDAGVKPFRVLGMSRAWGPAGSFAWDIRDGERLCLAIAGHPEPHYESPAMLDASHTDRWLHVALIYDAERGLVEHYVDGQRVAQLPIDNPPSLRPAAFEIGGWSVQRDRALDGVMDRFMMTNTAMNAEQINALWRLGAPGLGKGPNQENRNEESIQ